MLRKILYLSHYSNPENIVYKWIKEQNETVLSLTWYQNLS